MSMAFDPDFGFYDPETDGDPRAFAPPPPPTPMQTPSPLDPWQEPGGSAALNAGQVAQPLNDQAFAATFAEPQAPPPPRPAANEQEAYGEWKGFLGDDRNRLALMQLGLSLMAPMPPGQNAIGHFASALGDAGQAVAGFDKEREAGYDREIQRQQREVNLDRSIEDLEEKRADRQFKQDSSAVWDHMDYLVSKGVPKHVAAGLVGNVWQESNFRATAKGFHSAEKGLYQLHPKTELPHYQAWLQQSGRQPLSNGFDQHDFLLHRLQTAYPGTWQRLMASKSAQEASQILANEYERPSKKYEWNGSMWPNRARYADRALSIYETGGSGLGVKELAQRQSQLAREQRGEQRSIERETRAEQRGIEREGRAEQRASQRQEQTERRAASREERGRAERQARSIFTTINKAAENERYGLGGALPKQYEQFKGLSEIEIYEALLAAGAGAAAPSAPASSEPSPAPAQPGQQQAAPGVPQAQAAAQAKPSITQFIREHPTEWQKLRSWSSSTNPNERAAAARIMSTLKARVGDPDVLDQILGLK